VVLAILVQTLAFAMLFTNLASNQQVFDVSFGRGASFPMWFAGIALVSGTGSLRAIAQCLMPLFDPGFSPHSYGFRPGRNAQQAVHQIQHDIAQNRRHAVDIDLSKFFDRVNHDARCQLLCPVRVNYLGRFSYTGSLG